MKNTRKRVRKYSKSRLHEKMRAIGITTVALTIAGVTVASLNLAFKSVARSEQLIAEVKESMQTPVVQIIEINHTEVEEHYAVSPVVTSEVIDTSVSDAGASNTNMDTQMVMVKEESTKTYIRCTVYCDTGYTASGAWTEAGCVAGKREWLGKKCNLYRVNKDGSCGELIGTYTFRDTGFGLEELNGVEYPNGTIMSGASIDMWHPTEEQCWAWVAKYGDYVYMEFVD